MINLRLCSLLLFSAVAISADAANVRAPALISGGEIHFVGKVISLPCRIAPGDERIPVDFKDIALKDLISNGKTKPIPFTIHLLDCNTVVFNSVTVKFSGNESTKLPGRLTITAVDGGDMTAVGVGLQTLEGQPIELDKDALVAALSEKSMSLDFSAFVEGDITALKEGKVDLGRFTSTANYTLSYQ